MRDPKTGNYQREGRWQIMIHGESYKPIVADAAKKSADKVFNRICVTHLLMDDAKENRVAGAVGFNVRTGNYHVFKSKTVIVGAGGASNIFKPRSVGEGAGRVWYARCRRLSVKSILTLKSHMQRTVLFLPACVTTHSFRK